MISKYFAVAGHALDNFCESLEGSIACICVKKSRNRLGISNLAVKIRSMEITKFGHCCLLIEQDGVRLLTDPGEYSTRQNEARNLDAVLITHEHRDHLHLDSLSVILKNNPMVAVFTNRGAGKILEAGGIKYELLEDGDKMTVKGLVVEGVGRDHAPIYPPEVPGVENTGFMIGDYLFYPGDALTNPEREVAVLALPIAGPWLKISEALDYAKQVKPKKAFPVHDGMLKFTRPEHEMPRQIMARAGIEWVVPEEGRLTKI